MNRPILLSLACFGLIAAGCEKPDRTVRHYREVSMIKDDATKTAEMPMAPEQPPFVSQGGAGAMGELPPEMRTPSLPLEWQTPEGWEEIPGSGMRIATFMTEGQECSLMSFPGDVGGDEANIRRWLGQLGQSVSDEKLTSFASDPVRFETAGGYECKFFDYAKILPEGSAKSILAGIIVVGDHSVFVKLMGDATIVQKQKMSFESLCKSIRLKPESI
jgi:hypothetical protein